MMTFFSRESLMRFKLAKALLAVMAMNALSTAHAQSASAYPAKPIRMIVAVGAGGATDSMARRLAERLSKSLSQPISVENMAGGSGVIAAQTVAHAPADGYTLLIGTNTTHAGNAAFMKSLPYDPVGDFEPIARLAIAALVLCTSNDIPAQSVQEFIAYAKGHPGKIAFGAGTGSARLASELLKSKAGIDILSVPYKSNAPALTDLRGGQIQMLMGDIALMLPHIQSGAVRGLAVTSAQRSSTLPQMPTMQEAGVSGYELVGFIAAFAPKGTPRPVVQKLNEQMVAILRDKEFADTMTANGVDAAPSSPEALRDWVVSETRKWTELARGAGIQPE
jgi:tripartite-type tricarboxylate transporter receptor subunit TctC